MTVNWLQCPPVKNWTKMSTYLTWKSFKNYTWTITINFPSSSKSTKIQTTLTRRQRRMRSYNSSSIATNLLKGKSDTTIKSKYLPTCSSRIGTIKGKLVIALCLAPESRESLSYQGWTFQRTRSKQPLQRCLPSQPIFKRLRSKLRGKKGISKKERQIWFSK